MAKERQEQAVSFPGGGIDVSVALDRQPIRNANGIYAYTTPVAVNVVNTEPIADRARGGSRPGIKKYLATRPGGTRWIIQGLDMVVSVSAAARA